MNSLQWIRHGVARLCRWVPALLIPAASVLAAPFSSVVVYGDSLSDNGNFFAATAGIPGAPYFDGRRSNGPVAVEQLAARIGAPLIDFAWIGATTGVGNYGDGGTSTSFGAFNLPGMTTIFNATRASLAPLVADGLFIVWGGPNDFLLPSVLDTSPFDTIHRAITNELLIINELRAMGVQHVLAPGMADLGLTPYFQSIGQSAQGSALTDFFNTALMDALPSGVDYFDTAGLFRSVVGDPSSYGFTNVKAACFDSTTQTTCAHPDQYLFFDDFHPTAAGHAVLAREFAVTLGLPEPGTLWLLAIAATALGVSRRPRKGVGC